MPLLQKIICPKCGKTYSPLRATCPHCGEKNQTRSTRTPASSDSVRKGTEDNERVENYLRWQFIFGVCIVAAIIISVVALVLTGNSGNYDMAKAPTTPTPIVKTTPTPTPKPTPTPTPTPTVESVTITFLGQENTGFTMNVGDGIQLGSSVSPTDITEPVKWSSSDEGVCTVDSTGLVTGISSGNATVVAECLGIKKECPVIVR